MVWLQRPDVRTHPCGARSVPCGPLPGAPRAIAASWPIRARFDLICLKVSQNRVVSPKYTEKACHSPCIQNGLRKSPLEIPGFPILVAFSHKELMGLFDAPTGVYCQNDEVSTGCTRARRGRRYPLPAHCAVIPHLLSAGVELTLFSGILNEVGYY